MSDIETQRKVVEEQRSACDTKEALGAVAADRPKATPGPAQTIIAAFTGNCVPFSPRSISHSSEHNALGDAASTRRMVLAIALSKANQVLSE